MTSTVERIRAKVTRAKKHVEDFDVAARAFSETKPYAIEIKEDPQAGKRTYHLAEVSEVPLDIEAIAADALSNLRAALDHIAYQLEIAAGRVHKLRYIAYPIADGAAEYPALRDRYIKCAPQAAKDAIDRTEPYKGGKGHALWQLNELNRTDKHHLLVATSPYLRSLDLGGYGHNRLQRLVNSTEWGRDITIPEMHTFFHVADPQPLKHGDELFSESLDMEVDEHFQFRFDISFDKPGIIQAQPALVTLHEMADFVDGIVSAFEPLLPP